MDRRSPIMKLACFYLIFSQILLWLSVYHFVKADDELSSWKNDDENVLQSSSNFPAAANKKFSSSHRNEKMFFASTITPPSNVTDVSNSLVDNVDENLEDNNFTTMSAVAIDDDDDDDDSDNGNSKLEKSSPNSKKKTTKWVAEIFAEAWRSFDLPNTSLISERCYHDYQIYKAHLTNQSVWAVKMYESTEWPTTGLFNGFNVHFGNYDECLSAISEDSAISGRYCLTESSFNVKGNPNWEPSTAEILTDVVDQDGSVWDAITMYRKDPVRTDRTKLGWAMCLPATCTATDLKMALDDNLKGLFSKYNLDIEVNVKEELCQTKDSFSKPPKGYYVTSYFFLAIIATIIAATTYESVKIYSSNYDEKANKGNLPLRLFTSFSMVTNMKKLGKVDKGHDISSLHFIKILNILIIVYGHRFIYSVGYPKTDSNAVEYFYKIISSIELVHTNVVDVFFMISGFLTYYFGHIPMKKAGEIYYPMSIILRWFRMVPVFCALAAFVIFILPYMSDGPLWTERVFREVNNCGSTWWANLLIVNNFVDVEKQCLVVSWYISTDIQLCIIGGFLMYIMTKHQKCGLILTAFVFLLSAAITFTVAYVNHYDGVLRLYMSLLTEPRKSEQFNKFYIATYTRVGPYITGFMAAYLTIKLLERGVKFNAKQKLVISFLAILIGDGFQYYGCFLYVFGRPYIPLENALYASFNRTFLAAVFAVFIVLYTTSGLGFLNKFLRIRLFVPLARLTYCVFLVNTVIQLYHAASQRTPVPSFSRMTLVWLSAADIIMSYVFGLFLHLIIEAPITNITKMLQKKLTKVTVKKKSIDYTVESCQIKSRPVSRKNSKSSNIENGSVDNNGGYCNTTYYNNEDQGENFKDTVNSRL